ncbi:hypothetical protein [Roseibium sp. M-1]
MERSLVLFAIGLIFGGGIGFVVAAGNGVTFDGHDHSTGHAANHVMPAPNDPAAGQPAEHTKAHAGGHNHDMLVSLPAGPNAPTLDISLEPDPVSGWNLHILTENFTFAPAHAGLADVPGEGHAHIYVNGEKVARVYGPWFHVPALPKGAAMVEVTLNANDHSTLAIDGDVLKKSVMIRSE